MSNPVQEALSQFKLINQATPILIACSGGRDSMALLSAFVQGGFQHLEVAHCNFQLREQESDGDQAFVQAFCKNHNLEFHTIRFETESFARQEGISTQIAARRLRYEWFEKIRKERALHLIAVAHHQDDQAETILLNLLQGTGIHGLKGMLPKNDKIIRPFLHLSREDINRYISKENIAFREDSSNATNHYKRNFIRHDIFPLLKHINSNYLQELDDFSTRMLESEILFNNQISTIRKKALIQWKEGYKLHINYLLQHPACDTIFHEILTPFQLNKEQIKEIILTVKGIKKKTASGQTFFSKSHRFILDTKALYILPIQEALCSLLTYEKWPKQFIFNEYKIEVRVKPISKVHIHESKRYAYLDADLIQFPIQIRYFEAGDYFYPMGMSKSESVYKVGKKKLSKYFKDEKIPLAERERIPIIKMDKKILWVVGHRIDERFKVTEQTQNVLVLIITQPQ